MAVAVRAEAGGRRAMVAPERLRELCRLAVPNAVGHLPHRHRALPQELECPLHPHLREVGAEGRAADLGKRPLELTARCGYLSRDGIEVDLAPVIALDDRHCLAVQGLTPLQGCRTVRHYLLQRRERPNVGCCVPACAVVGIHTTQAGRRGATRLSLSQSALALQGV